MEMNLTAKEILGIAEDIERQAAAFFRAAAGNASGPRLQRSFLDLAAMEEEHRQVFAALKDQVVERPPDPGQGQSAGGARAGLALLARSVVENVQRDLIEKFAGLAFNHTVAEKAIDFEKDTIVFYTGIKGMLHDPADREKVEEIILQELGHVLSLRSGSLTDRG